MVFHVSEKNRSTVVLAGAPFTDPRSHVFPFGLTRVIGDSVGVGGYAAECVAQFRAYGMRAEWVGHGIGEGVADAGALGSMSDGGNPVGIAFAIFPALFVAGFVALLAHRGFPRVVGILGIIACVAAVAVFLMGSATGS